MIAELFSPENILFLLDGLLITLLIAALSILFSLIFGSLLGIMRSSRRPLLRRIAGIYVEIFRNIPNLLVIFAIGFLTPFDPIFKAVLAFTLFTSAVVAEIIRGGLAAIGRGQWEAARAQGFSYLGALWYIIMPQVFRAMLPPLVSQCITIIKDTSYVWVINIEDLTRKGSILIGKYTSVAQILMLFGTIAGIYFILNFALSLFARSYAKKRSGTVVRLK